jgi:anthranilate phosphoribosyltransferase
MARAAAAVDDGRAAALLDRWVEVSRAAAGERS